MSCTSAYSDDKSVSPADGVEHASPVEPQGLTSYISSRRKKCSVCQVTETNYGFEGNTMKWRECWKCMPPSHKKLLLKFLLSDAVRVRA